VLGDELLVRGDHRLARPEEIEDVCPRRVDPAHELGDDPDRRVVADRGEVGGQDTVGRRGRALLLRIADERAHDAKAEPGRPLDVLRVLDEETVDGGSDRPVAEEADADLDGVPRQPAPRSRVA